MAVETKRGCGYRKVGGLYLVSSGRGHECDRLPIPVMPCTVCGSRIKQTRSWQWVNLAHLLESAKSCKDAVGPCNTCPVCNPHLFNDETICQPVGKAGLIWIGEKFYPTPEAWFAEANKMGISRRVASIPRGFTVGQSWVFVAHPALIDGLDKKKIPGVFHVFRPERIELIVTPSMRSEPWVLDLVDKGVTLIEVPEDDPDHLPVKKAKKSRRRMAADRVSIDPPAKEDHQAKLFTQ